MFNEFLSLFSSLPYHPLQSSSSKSQKSKGSSSINGRREEMDENEGSSFFNDFISFSHFFLLPFIILDFIHLTNTYLNKNNLQSFHEEFMSQPFSNFFKENPDQLLLYSQICYKIGCIISELFCSMRFSTSFINSSFENQNKNQSSTTNCSFSTEQQNLNSHLFDPSQSTFELFGLDFLLCLEDENENYEQKEEEKKSQENESSKSKPPLQSPQLFNISPILLEVNPSPDIAQSGQSNFGMMLRLVNGILGFLVSFLTSKYVSFSLFLSIVLYFFLLSSFYSIL